MDRKFSALAFWIGIVSGAAAIVGITVSLAFYFANLENRLRTVEQQQLVLTTARALTPNIVDKNKAGVAPKSSDPDKSEPVPDHADTSTPTGKAGPAPATIDFAPYGNDLGYYGTTYISGPVADVCAEYARQYIDEERAKGDSIAAMNIRSLMTDLGCFPRKK